MRKRIISLVLTVVMLLSMLPVLSVPADANSTVKAKLDTFMNSYPSGGRWTGTFDGGSQCYGFAKMVLYNLFDQYHGWYYNGTPTKGLNVIGSTTDYSYSSVQSLLSNAKCGDLLQFDQTKQHSMIVYAVESDGVWIYDCNWDWNCGISLRKCSFGTWSGRNSNKLTLLRSTNYPEDNPPPKPTVYMNGTTSHLDIASGNSINFTFYAPEAETVHLFIYKWSDLIYDEYFSPSGSYTMKFDDVGKYSCVIIAHNSGGYTYSEWTDWTVRHTVIQRFISPYGKSYDCNTAYNNAVKSGYAQNKVYFWYRIYDTSTGDLYNSYTSKTYNVHMSIKDPDGNEISSCDYSNSDNNWLGFVPQKSGTYTCTTTVTGDINVTGSSTYSVSYNASLSASQNTVSLNLNGTNTASVNFTPSGSLPGKRAYSWSGENGVVSVSGGGWSSDGTYFTLNFKGLKYGSNDITVKLHEKYTESASVVATVLIHVNVDANKYTVSYNANGGTGAPSSQTKYYGTDLTLSSSRPSKSYTVTFNANGGTSSVTTKTANCMFNNWNTKSDGTGTTYSPGAAYTANAALALYAIWSNPTVGTLPTPTRSGYTFDGWYTTSNGGNKIYTSTTVSSNITYYAHWTPSDTTLPSGSISSTNNAASSQTVTLTMSDDVALAGYYWGTSSSTSPSFTSISGISKTVTVTVSSSGTYYLTVKDTGGNIFQTSKTFYKTTLDANGGSVSPTSIITASGNSFTFPTPTKDGYTYNGWSTSSTATSGITSLTPTGNTTYYAVWKIFVYINYTVTYDANGGTGAPPAQTAITGNSLILSSTIPTKEYTVTFDPNGGSVSETKRIVSSTFLSWNTESDGTGFVYRPGGTYSFNSSVTLYALWDVNSVGTLPTPTRNGYVFDGWYTASSGGNIRSASSIVASNTTYYAHWTAKDTTKPFVSVKITNNLSNYQTFTYTLSDNVGLAGYYFGADSSTSPNYKSISGTSYTGEIEIYTSGTYYLTVKDTGGNIYQTSYTFYKTTLNANGGSVSPAAILTVRGCSFDFPTPTKDGYTYNGWSTSSSATSGITSLTPTGDTTYYAVWKKNVNLSSISVKTMPTKTTYNIGDPLDTTGLSLSLNYDDGSVKTITSGYTVSGFDTSTAGSKYVKVNYGGFSTGFQIMVIDSTTIVIK
ncbi:MAG: InlB B-repeat-containing protein, partial [Clostridia bacterium]|nr:InlB B-repeat-containing protein [Clostridia bacterium]